MDGGETHWYVELPDGDVHRVTFGQLDEAFQLGHIDSETMVLAARARQWTRLGTLAGFEGGATVRSNTLTRSPRTLAGPGPMLSQRPVSIDLSDVELVTIPPNKWWLLAAAAAALALVGGGTTVALAHPAWAQPMLSRLGGRSAPAVVATAAPATAAPAAAKPVAPPPPVAMQETLPAPAPPPPIPEANADAPADAPSEIPSADVADDTAPQPAADKANGRKGKGRRKRAPKPGAHPASTKGHPATFTTGANKYDGVSSGI